MRKRAVVRMMGGEALVSLLQSGGDPRIVPSCANPRHEVSGAARSVAWKILLEETDLIRTGLLLKSGSSILEQFL